ncbi:MAG: ArsR/SmtB family transcription factor [Lysinibacillus sp.]
MGHEIDISEHNEEQVIYLSSPVIETLALFSSLIQVKNDFLSEERETLEEAFKNNFAVIHLKKLPDYSVYNLFNFLIPIPHFSSVELFAESLKRMAPGKFLYYFWGEDLPLETVVELWENPERIWELERSYYWQTDEVRALYQQWLPELPRFRDDLAELLLDISKSTVFQAMWQERKPLMEASIRELQQLSMPSLSLAQYVMGKTFRRTSLYKMYYFIPSYCMTPGRIRIFNESVCMVIYGCANALSDERQASDELAVHLKALADPNRLLILRLLSVKKEYGAKLAEYIGLTTATISHHLDILKKAGLVKEEKIGTIKYFAVDKEQVTEMMQRLQHLIGE